VVCATGGSTNAALHLPAIAHEAGIRFHLDDVAEIFARTPLIADLKPGGCFLARCLLHRRCGRHPAHPAGAGPAAWRCTHLHGPHAGRGGGRCCRARRRSGAQGRQPDLGRRRAHGAQGQSVPDGALLKTAGSRPWCRGPARVFDPRNRRRTPCRPWPTGAAMCW
jgi:dihydroxy-acid dehydratase